jgi:hypothetical protein
MHFGVNVAIMPPRGLPLCCTPVRCMMQIYPFEISFWDPGRSDSSKTAVRENGDTAPSIPPTYVGTPSLENGFLIFVLRVFSARNDASQLTILQLHFSC